MSGHIPRVPAIRALEGNAYEFFVTLDGGARAEPEGTALLEGRKVD